MGKIIIEVTIAKNGRFCILHYYPDFLCMCILCRFGGKSLSCACIAKLTVKARFGNLWKSIPFKQFFVGYIIHLLLFARWGSGLVNAQLPCEHQMGGSSTIERLLLG